MPRPDTVPSLIQLIRRSGLIDDADLNAFFADPGPPPKGHPVPAVLDRLVDRGLLTRFQADGLAAGQAAGFVLAGYRLRERIGYGGMSQVFLADPPGGGPRVAVKVLATGLRADRVARDRLEREARAAAAVSHTGVVRVIDTRAAHDPPFLVMEYVDGISLQAAVARHGTFSYGEVAAIGWEVVDALGAIAAARLVHRDVKPANLLIDRSGDIKLIDLGVARFLTDNLTRLTGGMALLGTVDYLAPEQAIDCSAVDHRADLYGLGATLYFLLAGHPPFPTGLPSARLLLKQTTNPAPVRDIRPDMPEGLGAVIDRLLAREPAERFGDASEVVAALAPWVDRPASFPERLFLPATKQLSLPACPTDSGSRSSGTGEKTVQIVRHPVDEQGPMTITPSPSATLRWLPGSTTGEEPPPPSDEAPTSVDRNLPAQTVAVQLSPPRPALAARIWQSVLSTFGG